VLGLGLIAALAPRRTTAAPTAGDVRAAREQFDLAVVDEDAGRWGDALARLRRIAAVKDTAGVRYHIALCEEQLGHLASALTEYRSAERAAQSDPSQSHDVLRLVGKRIDGLAPRVPTLTVRVEAAVSDAALRVDGRPARVGEPIPLDPGSHPVEVEATGGSGGATVDVAEGEKKVVLVPLGRPPAATSGSAGQAEPFSALAVQAGTSDALVATRGAAPPAAPGPGRAGGPRASVLFEVAGAAVLAGAGALAFAEAGAMRDAGMRSCAQVTSLAPAACDAERAAVRAWDWIAVGAWAGAAGLATLAVVSWSTPRGASGNVTVGLGAVRWGGAF
jgi:hypothetical protein